MLSEMKNEKNLTKSEKQLKRRKHFHERESRKSDQNLETELTLRNIYSCILVREPVEPEAQGRGSSII